MRLQQRERLSSAESELSRSQLSRSLNSAGLNSIEAKAMPRYRNLLLRQSILLMHCIEWTLFVWQVCLADLIVCVCVSACVCVCLCLCLSVCVSVCSLQNCSFFTALILSDCTICTKCSYYNSLHREVYTAHTHLRMQYSENQSRLQLCKCLAHYSFFYFAFFASGKLPVQQSFFSCH